MLLAYSLSAHGLLTADTISALSRAERQLAGEVFKGLFTGLALRWDDVTPGEVDGPFVRGYVRASTRARVVAMIDALHRLSREFPGIAVHVSGWGDLPPTTIRAGAFELFAEVYGRALADAARPENRWHCS